MPLKNIQKLGCLFCIFQLLTGCVEGGVYSASSVIDRTADEASIRELINANANAVNSSDPDGVQKTFAPGGDGWIAGTPRLTGSELRDAEDDFENLPGFQSWDVDIQSIRFISRDAAIVEITATTTLDTGQFDEETTIVVAKVEGEWKIEAWRVMVFPDALLKMMK